MTSKPQVEFDGDAYRAASAHQTAWGLALIDDLALAGTERVLDLGCGDGRLTAEIARRVPIGAVVGVDSAPGMIEAATAFSGPNLSFREQRIETLDEAGTWDVVFSNATLHWVLDHVDLLQRIRSALRPGGLARLNFASVDNSPSVIRALRTLTAEPRFAGAFDDFTWPWFMPSIDAYRALVEDAGFMACEVFDENADRAIESETALIGWLDQQCLIPFLRHLPEALREPFRQEAIDMLLAATRQPDGTLFEVFRRVHVRARA